MAIAHDAWLFSPTAYSQAMADYAKSVASDRARGYQVLRAASVASLDHAVILAGDYGGWDRRSLLAELPAEFLPNSECIETCFMILLYVDLAQRAELLPGSVCRGSVGLMSLWNSFEMAAKRLGWSAVDSALLVRGHNFALLAEQHLRRCGLTSREVGEITRIWTHMRPDSIAASLGWLDVDDVRRLAQRVKEGISTLGDLTSSGEGVLPSELDAFRRAGAMLQAPTTHCSGLCVILSG